MAERPPIRGSVPALVVALLVLAMLPDAASATHRGSEVIDETYLEITFQRSTLAGVTDQLVADVRAVNGPAVAGVAVEFVREVDFLGPRRVSLGQATTDAWGSARIPLNATTRQMTVVARFAGNAAFAASEKRADIVLAPAPMAPGSGPLAGDHGTASLAVIAAVMPTALALMAAVVWLILLGLSLATVRAIRRGRHQLQAESSKE